MGQEVTPVTVELSHYDGDRGERGFVEEHIARGDPIQYAAMRNGSLRVNLYPPDMRGIDWRVASLLRTDPHMTLADYGVIDTYPALAHGELPPVVDTLAPIQTSPDLRLRREVASAAEQMETRERIREAVQRVVFELMRSRGMFLPSEQKGLNT